MAQGKGEDGWRTGKHKYLEGELNADENKDSDGGERLRKMRGQSRREGRDVICRFHGRRRVSRD